MHDSKVFDPKTLTVTHDLEVFDPWTLMRSPTLGRVATGDSPGDGTTRSGQARERGGGGVPRSQLLRLILKW